MKTQKIESLTPKQEKRMPEFAKKWIDIGLKTGPANRAVAEKACRDAYQEAGLPVPKLILWADSPMGLLMTAKLMKELFKKDVSTYDASVSANVMANVGNNVRDNVWFNVRVNVMDTVRANVMDNVWGNVMDTVRATVMDNVRDNVVNSSLRDEWNDCNSYGQHDASWLGFYDFFKEVCGLNICKRLEPMSILAQETGWHLFYSNVAILSERATEIHLNSDKRLHNPSGPAMKWKDGWEIYSLNGIKVPKEIALLKPEEITKDTILKQENADYRREIVRKLSPTQLVNVLDAKVLDEKSGYSLLSIDLGDRRERPFLKMINPSIDAVHVEGVLPSCKTVSDAINFRNGVSNGDLPITIDGFEMFEENGNYFQQGDLLLKVCDIPKDAKKVLDKIAGEGLIRHILENGDIFEKNGIRYILPYQNCRIIHPEHRPTILPEGLEVVISKVKEYDHWLEESREVID